MEVKGQLNWDQVYNTKVWNCRIYMCQKYWPWGKMSKLKVKFFEELTLKPIWCINMLTFLFMKLLSPLHSMWTVPNHVDKGCSMYNTGVFIVGFTWPRKRYTIINILCFPSQRFPSYFWDVYIQYSFRDVSLFLNLADGDLLPQIDYSWLQSKANN